MNGNDVSRIEKDIIGWDSIEDHRTGTEGDRKTTDWLANLVEEAGGHPRIDEFKFTRRVLGHSFVSIDGTEINGIPLFDAPATPKKGIRGVAVTIESSSGIGIDSFTPNDGNTALTLARTKQQLDAIVAYSQSEVGGLSLLNADDFNSPFGPPVLQVSSKHRDLLEEAKSSKKECTVYVEFDQESTTASNVQVKIPGKEPDLPEVIIMTPKSAWWTCTAERCGGIAIWLACLRHFIKNQPKRSIEFTANTGHELGHLGLDHYLVSRKEKKQETHVWLHLGANFSATNSKIRFQASDEALMKLGIGCLNNSNIEPDQVTKIGSRPFGEARNIFDQNGRYLSLLGTNRWFHNSQDRWPISVNVSQTERLTKAVVTAATTIANQ